MKTISYERLFFLGSPYEKEGHERIAFSETVEDSVENEAKVKEMFLKVLGLHETFQTYRTLLKRQAIQQDRLESAMRNLSQQEDSIVEAKLREITDPDEVACNKKHLKAMEKRRDELKVALNNLSAEKQTLELDLRNTKERIGVQ